MCDNKRQVSYHLAMLAQQPSPTLVDMGNLFPLKISPCVGISTSPTVEENANDNANPSSWSSTTSSSVPTATYREQMLITQVNTLTEEVVSLSNRLLSKTNTLETSNNMLAKRTITYEDILIEITNLCVDSQQSIP
eukprot:4873629-Ditylum_brightwellii.AAC.1